ncbi:MAG: exodeoxyribonuclease VII large subunit [Eubacteriaceae bacterium]
MESSRVFTVSEVNQYLKTLLESNSILKNLSIQGELSNVRRATSGHLYFSLKDNGGKIDCVMFKNAVTKLKINYKEGSKVTLKGSLSVYTTNGQYQIIVRTMEALGIGDLYQAYLKLKDDMESKGYFDSKHKKTIPTEVSRVGLVTSPKGAAVEDMISIIQRRNPLIDIILYPATVQGEGASESIAKGIQTFNQLDNVDVIIIGRGGGAIEDLWAFNDKSLGMSIFESRIPIISGVGHETDFTIADFVADLRAPTPSAAAELVSEELKNLVNMLEQKKVKLIQSIHLRIEKERNNIFNKKMDLNHLKPEKLIEKMRLDLDGTQERLTGMIIRLLKKEKECLNIFEKRLKVGNPLNLLERGYILVLDKKNKPVTRMDKIALGDKLTLVFKDGEVETKVHSIKEKE